MTATPDEGPPADAGSESLSDNGAVGHPNRAVTILLG